MPVIVSVAIASPSLGVPGEILALEIPPESRNLTGQRHLDVIFPVFSVPGEILIVEIFLKIEIHSPAVFQENFQSWIFS